MVKPSYEGLQQMTIAELKEMMKKKDIRPLSGTKIELVNRIALKLNIQSEKSDRTTGNIMPTYQNTSTKYKPKAFEGPSYKNIQLRRSFRKILETAKVRNDFNHAGNYLLDYNEDDKKNLIIELLIEDYYVRKTSLEESIALLDSIINIFKNKMTYAEIERYFVPFLTKVATKIQSNSKSFERKAQRLGKSLKTLVDNGFDPNTVFTVLARSDGTMELRDRVLFYYLEEAQIPDDETIKILNLEKEYLESKLIGKYKIPDQITDKGYLSDLDKVNRHIERMKRKYADNPDKIPEVSDLMKGTLNNTDILLLLTQIKYICFKLPDEVLI